MTSAKSFQRGDLVPLVDGTVAIVLDHNIKEVNYGTEIKRYIKVSSLCDKILDNNYIDLRFISDKPYPKEKGK